MNEAAQALVTRCATLRLTVATAESCTGGLLAAAITAVPGASAVFGTGFVTYSNAAKTNLLGVPAGLITSVGAVSEAVARRMAQGARERAVVDLAVSITGIAGPDGGTAQKPVGTVWFGMSSPLGVQTRHMVFKGGRDAVRQQSAVFALHWLLETSRGIHNEQKHRDMGKGQARWPQDEPDHGL
jgi:nicotinamide-nucleotide amidase